MALSVDWGFDEILLATAGPAEVNTRLRLLVTPRATAPGSGRGRILSFGELVIDEVMYTVRLRGQPLELTYTEFELLKFLARHAGQVFTREQLLKEVWGYDFFGGARTVDVHVGKLRAKLGPEHERLIGTVRKVGYTFVRPPCEISSRERVERERPAADDVSAGPADRRVVQELTRRPSTTTSPYPGQDVHDSASDSMDDAHYQHYRHCAQLTTGRLLVGAPARGKP